MGRWLPSSKVCSADAAAAGPSAAPGRAGGERWPLRWSRQSPGPGLGSCSSRLMDCAELVFFQPQSFSGRGKTFPLLLDLMQ